MCGGAYSGSLISSSFSISASISISVKGSATVASGSSISVASDLDLFGDRPKRERDPEASNDRIDGHREGVSEMAS